MRISNRFGRDITSEKSISNDLNASHTSIDTKMNSLIIMIINNNNTKKKNKNKNARSLEQYV